MRDPKFVLFRHDDAPPPEVFAPSSDPLEPPPSVNADGLSYAAGSLEALWVLGEYPKDSEGDLLSAIESCREAARTLRRARRVVGRALDDPSPRNLAQLRALYDHLN